MDQTYLQENKDAELFNAANKQLEIESDRDTPQGPGGIT